MFLVVQASAWIPLNQPVTFFPGGMLCFFACHWVVQAVKTTVHIDLRKQSRHFGTEYRDTSLPTGRKGPVREEEPSDY